MSLFEREDDYGNVEYKRKYTLDTKHKINKCITQMKYRITEGFGEAYYLLGINDDGSLSFTNTDLLNLSLNNIKKIANALNYNVVSILNCNYESGKFIIVKICSNIDIYNDLNYFII